MQLNINKFIMALSEIQEPCIFRNRAWNTRYNNETCSYWNYLLWEKFLVNASNYGSTIDKYELYDFCKYTIDIDKSDAIFNKLNKRSRAITFAEFEDFLERIEDDEYDILMDCLEPEHELEPEPELEPSNTPDLEEFKTIILDGISSPDDGRDWIFDKILNKQHYSLPKILDYRNELLPVRNQGSQGTCFAQSAACMKEWQEKKDYGLDDYLSPQFFYNNRDNLYDNIEGNDAGMFGRNVMKLLSNIGICTEYSYPYGTIEHKDIIKPACYLQAAQHTIAGYGRVMSVEALKYCLKFNGLCLIAFPIYNYSGQMWLENPGDKFLGGHAMTVVGYLEDCFIIRNSWGPNWGDGGYCYYYFKDWGAHWEIWTTVDSLGSKLIKDEPDLEPEPEPEQEPDLEPDLEPEPDLDDILTDVDSEPSTPKREEKQNLLQKFFQDIFNKFKNFFF